MTQKRRTVCYAAVNVAGLLQARKVYNSVGCDVTRVGDTCNVHMVAYGVGCVKRVLDDCEAILKGRFAQDRSHGAEDHLRRYTLLE